MTAVLVERPATAQAQTEVPPAVAGAKPVGVERVKVHGASLAGNLEGNAADRDVLVFLPPGYARETRRYPVVYALHGYSISAEQWKLHEVLIRNGIANTFEVYAGTHTSKVADRFQHDVLPFFSRSLCPEHGCR